MNCSIVKGCKMPEKIATYSSYGQKLITLFAKLLFSRESYSLTELARMLKCSKQTVLRLVDDIRMAYSVDIEESIENRRKYYRIKRRISTDPLLNLTESEIATLHMCRSFTQHLLGRKLYEEATEAVEKSMGHLPEDRRISGKHFGSFLPGTIDYSVYHDIIRKLIRAMDDKKVCRVKYKGIMEDRAKTFYIKPLKLFSHKETVYLHAKIARYPGRRFKESEFDPLLAIHRVEDIKHTDRSFEFPKKYDFEEAFNKQFGIIKDEAFKVEIEFTGWSARYVTERIWSPDQRIIKKRDGKILLIFSSSSESEVISWILFFGRQAKVLKPKWLPAEISKELSAMRQIYDHA